MKINYEPNTKYVFYETEIERALEWLIGIRDTEYMGWAWVQFIRPNEQNTAEVIYSFAENEEWLKQHPEYIPAVVESINYWLIDTSHAEITIDYGWVVKALQKVRKCETIYNNLDKDKLDKAVKECLDWLENNMNIPREGKISWGVDAGETSNVIRTSLVVMGFYEEFEYLSKAGTDEERRERYHRIADSACDWLVSVQNRDGGWGNTDGSELTQEYQLAHKFSFEDLKYQCDSNAASTGYAMLALTEDPEGRYLSHIREATAFLKSDQTDNGGWPVFTEVGVRAGERYTFRHFGTAWALQGMIHGGGADYTDECIIHGFGYLSALQDDIYGGWKSSPDADNYTWATCNALSTIYLLKNDLADVHASKFLNVVWDWWTMKKKDTSYNFRVGNVTFAFNGAMALMFCITFSIAISLFLLISFNWIEPMFGEGKETARKLVFSVITVLDAVVLGLPWIVYVKNRFRAEVPGWIDSIGWVYGIITGFVLVLYQFVL